MFRTSDLEKFDPVRFCEIARVLLISPFVPGARVVRLRDADHYVYLANEADVLREMKSFLSTLR
jgi:hypothetical protein